MNNPSSTVPEPNLGSQAIAPAAALPTRPFYWSVQRELWEYRSVYIAPLAAAALFLFGFLISTVHLAIGMHAFGVDPIKRRETLEAAYNLAAGLIMGTAVIIEVIYCVEALHGERRDRSILFWKSLPVSDLTTVFAKATIPFIILPSVAFAILVVTYFIMLLLSSAVLLGSGLGVATQWTQFALSQKLLAMLYHFATVHVLWYAPIYGWLLLVSGWARRVPFLWAVITPIAISAFEKIVFHTSYLASWFEYRLSGPEAFVQPTHSSTQMDWAKHIDLGRFLSTPGLWVGLAVAAGLLLAAARARRYRGPI